MDPAGKRALVTGGGSGIGRAVTAALDSAGAKTAVFDISPEALKRLSTELPGVKGVVCDVADPESVDAAWDNLLEDWGGVDILVNNAGLVCDGPLVGFSAAGLKTYDLQDWRRVIAVNLEGVFLVTRRAAAAMVRDRTAGVVVNISSVAAVGNPGQSAYSAAKAGVEALTVTWAGELAPLKVRVVAVAPGFTDTAITRAMPPEALKRVVARTPLRRTAAPGEIADTVMFAVRNDFLTGCVLPVDGGLRL